MTHPDRKESSSNSAFRARVSVDQDPRLGEKIRTQYSIEVWIDGFPGSESIHSETKKTYTEIVFFRNALASAFPDVDLPPVPPKRIFQRFDPRVIQERSRAFQALFDAIGDVPKVHRSSELMEFFGAPFGCTQEDQIPYGSNEGDSRNGKEWRREARIQEIESKEWKMMDSETNSEDEQIVASTIENGDSPRAPPPMPFTWKEHPLELPVETPQVLSTEKAFKKRHIPRGNRTDPIVVETEDGQDTELGSDLVPEQSQMCVPEERTECLDMARDAARSGKGDVLRTLLSSGKLETGVVDGQGMTLLHLAALFGHKEAATVLLEAGSDPFAKNKQNETPLQLACPSLAKAITEWLHAHGKPVAEEMRNGNSEEAFSSSPRAEVVVVRQDNIEEEDPPPAYTEEVTETTKRLDSVALS